VATYRLRTEVRAELARDLEGWIDRIGLRAVTEITNEVLQSRRRRGHPAIDDDLAVIGMKLLMAQDQTLTPWAATGTFASGVSESARHSERKRIFKKYKSYEQEFLKRHPNGVLRDAVRLQALEHLDQATKRAKQRCLDYGIGNDDRLAVLGTLEFLRYVITLGAVTVLPTGEVIPRDWVICTPEVTPDGEMSVIFRGSEAALDRAFTLMTRINE
jgi:hypothetical protein